MRFLPGRAPAPSSPAAALAVDRSGPLIIPVAGVRRADLRSSWHDLRGGGTREHTGIDIMAPGATPVVAVAPGTVEKLWHSAAGGITLYLRSAARDRIYYYAHLAGYAPGVREGLRVRAGDPLGYVGDTGNAGPGNTHLHFGIALATPADRWHQGTPVDPYPLLAGAGASR